MPTDVKPGLKTTELWFMVAGTVAAALVAFGVWTPSDSEQVQAAVQAAATAVLGVLPSVYALARAWTKASARSPRR